MRPSEEELADCLKRCGVRREEREQILACGREGSAARQRCLLSRQRGRLLEELHRTQRRLDLMDLVLDSLEREGGSPARPPRNDAIDHEEKRR